MLSLSVVPPGVVAREFDVDAVADGTRDDIGAEDAPPPKVKPILAGLLSPKLENIELVFVVPKRFDVEGAAGVVVPPLPNEDDVAMPKRLEPGVAVVGLLLPKPANGDGVFRPAKILGGASEVPSITPNGFSCDGAALLGPPKRFEKDPAAGVEPDTVAGALVLAEKSNVFCGAGVRAVKFVAGAADKVPNLIGVFWFQVLSVVLSAEEFAKKLNGELG